MLEYEFLRMIQESVRMYKAFPLPAIICDTQFTVYWSNPSAKVLHYACTRPDGMVRLLHAYQPEELLVRMQEHGSYTLHNVFPLSGISVNLSPVFFNGRQIGVLVLFLGPQSIPTPNSFCDISRTAEYLSSAVRSSLNDVFAVMDSIAFRLETIDLGEISNSLDMVSVNCYRILRIVNNIAEYARQQSGQREYHFSLVNLFGWLEDMREVLHAQCEQLGIPFEMNLPQENVFVQIDPEAFAQVLFCCLHNSLYFTRPHNRIQVQARLGKRHVTLFVLDYGSGIPADVLPHIFEPYFSHNQFGETAMGLGLTLAKTTLYAHNGHIRIFSQVNKGTLVAMRLPLQTPFSQRFPLAQGIQAHWLTDRFSPVHIALMDAVLSPYRATLPDG